MLTYSFENRGSEFLYIHLYRSIRDDILSGALGPETRLPSKRALAEHLGVSAITVENAYLQLHSEGYLYTLPRKGFYVTKLEPAPKSPTSRRPQKAQSQHTERLGKEQAAHYSFDFVSNRVPPGVFPFSTWNKCTRAATNSDPQALLEAVPSGGALALRESICRHLSSMRGMDIIPEQVIIGAGTEYLYGLLIQLLGRELVYSIEDPGFRTIAHIYRSFGVAYELLPMDENGVCIDGLSCRRIDVAHVSPSHHYPTGVVTPISRRYELLSWASETSGRYIIEDDYDSELRLSGGPIPTLQSIDSTGAVIYTNTFSKTLSSTIRIAYMVLPRQLIALFKERLGFYSCTVSNFEQYTLARFMDEGYFERHLSRTRTHFRKVRDALIEAIERSALQSFIRISEKEAGLHFIMRFETGNSDDALIAAAAGNGVRLSCLSQYHLKTGKAPDSHCILMNYSSITEEQAPQAVKALENALLPLALG